MQSQSFKLPSNRLVHELQFLEAVTLSELQPTEQERRTVQLPAGAKEILSKLFKESNSFAAD